MNVKKSTAEEVFLKLFKAVILMLMMLSLLVTAAALIYAGYQYNQTPKVPAPAQNAPAKSVTIDDFLKQLKPEASPQEAANAAMVPAAAASAPEASAPVPAATTAPAPDAKPESEKYKEEANKILACLKEANQLAGLPQEDKTTAAREAFRQQLQAVADVSTKDRGQPFVTNASTLTCELIRHPKVVAYRKAKPDAEVFYAALNFNISTWDDMKTSIEAFDAKEQERMNRYDSDEQLRVKAGQEAAKFTLLVAGGAFVMFMALALSLLVAAIESNLRRMSRSLQEFH